MHTSAVLMFLGTLAACVLLVLVTFSVPFISIFYFLKTSAAGTVTFGIWGFCVDITGVCTQKKLEYSFDPQIMKSLTTALVLYPVAAGLTLFGLLSLTPLLYPYPLFALLSILAFLTSLAAFAVMMFLFTTAKNRFHAEGFTATYGPAVWMSLAATAVLLLLAVNVGCGTFCGGRFGRQAPHLAYSY
ncbi:hypothetical protein A0H81_13729 [Grifola frondosa]|uniref:Uncharacterized protein n=1 Tax=Grifola frondosa TaxID=5627 RepID=A0A1C7LNP2_GRIFR|nr:hypothetical protein A0H81_13729 [Grifola frondosa]